MWHQVRGYYLEVDDGAQEPQPQLALAHGGDALVQQAKHAEALLALADAHRRGMLFLLRIPSDAAYGLLMQMSGSMASIGWLQQRYLMPGF